MITVTFADGCLLATASKSLWQYDYGQQLEIVGLDLPEVFQVDFCNSGDTSTITVLGENNVVSIPDQFILDGRGITAFCFVYDETTGGTTRAEMKLPVLPRPERTEEQPDPEQEHVIDQLISELEENVEDAEAWAVGERDGVPVSEGDPTYNNSAKYWARKAMTDAPVTSVNGKTGDIVLDLDDIPNGETYARATPAQLAQIGETADDIADIDKMIPSTTSESNHLVNLSFLNNRFASYRTSAAQDTIDNGKQEKITAFGILKRDRSGNITGAIAGTDYLTADALNGYRKASAQDAIDNAQNTEIGKNTAALDTMQPAATAADIGKALIVKAVQNGKPSAYEYGEAGGGGGSALTAGDGIDITDDVISNTQGIEYIVGTQTGSTASWKGNSTDETLKVGKIIAYYLPFAGSSLTNATLTLTMAGGAQTAAIPLRRTGTSAVTNQFAAGNVIILIYDGTYWRVSAYYDQNDNTVPTGYCLSPAATAAKAATCSYGYRGDAAYFPCLFRYANTATDATLAITTYAPEAAPIYVNGARTSASNTFSAGVILLLYYNGAYYCYNDGRFPILVDGAVTSVQEYAAGLSNSKQSIITASGILKGDGAGGVSSAVAGVDYLQSAPVTSVNGQTGDVTVQAATDAQVTTAVNTWLGENVAQETGYVLDASLTMSNAAPPASAVGELKSAVEKNNSANILDNVAVSTSTTVGITFSVIDKQTMHVEGTSTSLAIKNIYSSQTMPAWVEKGKQYYLEYSTESEKVLFRVYIYRNGSLVSPALVEAVSNQVFTIPTDATGVIFRLAVKSGNTVNEDVTFAVLTAESNSQLSNNIENLRHDIDSNSTSINNLEKNTIKNNIPSASVASGDDLNDSKYLTPGQWKITSTAIAVSLVNRPIYLNSTGTLTVVNTHNSNHVYQLIMSNQGTAAWTRHVRIDTGVFDDWCSVISSSGYSWKSNNFLIHTPSEESRYMINALKAINVNITSSMDWPRITNGERNLSSDVAYALWDALQAKYQEYIDPGETIAYSLDTNGNDYKPVKAYYIHPKLTYGVSGQIQYPDMPTVYITAGTHGSEPTPVWNLYAIFARAFESDSIYADFLTGKKYRVVPCFSRWSYDHAKRYLAAAYNADGTTKESAIDPNTGEISALYDANRQCICSNNDSPSYDTLTMNSFATEAIGLINYLRTNGYSPNNDDCYIDLHNNSESLGYFGSWRQDLRNDFDVMIDRLAKIWKQHATWANGDPVDYYNSSISDHTALNGKICARTVEQLTFAWFFYYAANQSKSMLLEVQPYDAGGNANSYALAKGMDMTYRWFKVLME